MKKLLLPFFALLIISGCQAAQAPAPEAPDTAYPAQFDEKKPSSAHVEQGNDAVSMKDLIEVESPKAGEKITSPLTVTGKARGTWFFEGSFPVMLLDDQGNTLAQVPATSSESWMTEEFIPFEATLEFEAQATQGELVLQKDNPSGLEKLNEELRIPVQF